MSDLYLRDTAKTIRSWSEHDVAMKPDLAFDVIQTVAGRVEEAADHIETLETRIRELEGALRGTRQIVCDAAETGFNCHDGDWADRLFRNNGVITNALRAALEESE